MKTPLSKLRQSIDDVDGQIARLLNKRAELALSVGKSKNLAATAGAGKAVYVPSREKEVLKKVKAASRVSKGKLSGESLEAIYCEIISACRNLDTPNKIAFLGPWATFSHQAAIKNFGSSGFFIPTATAGEALKEVESGRADFAVVPVENSNEGSVNGTLDILVETELKICAEISLKIEQSFLVKDQKVQPLRIYSHSHALAQCQTWLARNYPDAELIPVSSTAEAAKKASKESSAAAVASEAAGKIYKLFVLQKGIQDNRENFTRFFVVGKILTKPTGKDKTSLVFIVKDKVGALYNILGVFNKNKVNLTKIESRPTKKKAWEYMFFVDIEGHIDDAKIVKTLGELKKHLTFIKTLGSYPKA
ncbi:MAG: prephenate dehydratase [Endomicrobium sp.]|jgi:chorismate mutase/prephenate dehydratase|nr:prephenate dehydratase [Endomicrobium sp.]